MSNSARGPSRRVARNVVQHGSERRRRERARPLELDVRGTAFLRGIA
jgi:hypothetical protein